MKDRQFWIGVAVILVLYMIYWFMGHPYFNTDRLVMFWAILTVAGVLIFSTRMAKRGEEIHLRTIPGLKAMMMPFLNL